MCRCETIFELISAELDGELTPEKSGELYAHLEQCGACMELYLEIRLLHETVPDLSTQAPENFAAAVMDRIRAESGRTSAVPPAAKTRNRRWKTWGGLAAVLVLAVLGASRLILPGLQAAGGTAAAATACGTVASSKTAYTSSTQDSAGTMEAQPAQTPAPDAPPSPNAVPEMAQSRLFIDSGAGKNQETQAEDTAGTDGTDSGESGEMLFGIAAMPVVPALPSLAEVSEEDGSITALDAGYLVLQSVDPDNADEYRPSEDNSALVLSAETPDGTGKSLAYNGIGKDSGRYEFTFTQDGLLQQWSAAVDGSEVQIQSEP